MTFSTLAHEGVTTELTEVEVSTLGLGPQVERGPFSVLSMRAGSAVHTVAIIQHRRAPIWYYQIRSQRSDR